MTAPASNPIGAICSGDRTGFCVWAPKARSVDVHVVFPRDEYHALDSGPDGYYSGSIDGLCAGARYFFRLDKKTEHPDPASRYQPEGVHGPSEVTESRFDWTDHGWTGIPLHQYIFYELHVGTFTPEGSFEAVISHIDELIDLGVTAIELMPVAQFSGARNWGYDGVFPFAVQNSYGGPEGLKRLVNACHEKGMAVVLDVVYNHLGPEGNCLQEYGHYFSHQYQTPWGEHFNFDGPYSDEVRRYFIENATHWFTEFHIDGLRLDAVHAILDFSAVPFLQELADTVHALGRFRNRRLFLFPESALNDVRLLKSADAGGYGLDAQWNDDFHHALHTVMTGEKGGYYSDFGRLDQMAKAICNAFVFDGTYSDSRKRRHGNSTRAIPAERFVVFSQNHDQIGNRMLGDRLTCLLSEPALKLSAAVVLLSPYLPLLFMGEEYGEIAPFPYFVSHTDPELIHAVRKGRSEEFEGFRWEGSPPDPQSPDTFHSAVLNRKGCLESEKNRRILEFYRRLIRLRKEDPVLSGTDKDHLKAEVLSPHPVIRMERRAEEDTIFAIFHFSGDMETLSFLMPEGDWKIIIDSTRPENEGRMVRSDGHMEWELEPYVCLVFGRAKAIRNS